MCVSPLAPLCVSHLELLYDPLCSDLLYDDLVVGLPCTLAEGQEHLHNNQQLQDREIRTSTDTGKLAEICISITAEMKLTYSAMC